MDYCISIVSNKPRRMRTCVLNALDKAAREEIEVSVLVVDASAEHDFSKNHEALSALSQEFSARILHLNEFVFKQLAAHEFGKKIVFEGRFGGARNAALFANVLRGEHTVFFDDDCIALDDCLSRFKKLFAAGKKIIVGAYSGKNTGLTSLLAKLQNALTAFAEKRISREAAAARVEEALRGISDDYELVREGFRGGNLGVSVEAARAHCFLPTSYRIEDAVFCKTTRFFVGENAFIPSEEEVPVVFHKPDASALDSLYKNWVESVRGASIALCVNALLEQGLEPTRENIERTAPTALKQLMNEFSEEKLAERRVMQKQFDDVVRELGAPELEREYLRVVNVSRADVELPPAELAREVKRFFQAREEWLELLKQASEKSFVEKIEEFVVG